MIRTVFYEEGGVLWCVGGVKDGEGCQFVLANVSKKKSSVFFFVWLQMRLTPCILKEKNGGFFFRVLWSKGVHGPAG